jgi:ferric-dicitrate binding protein FerR (iron transport regulator)
MDFNQDEFLILLLRQLENCTNWDEDRYIDRMLRKYEAARQMKQDVRDTFPEQADKHPYFVTCIPPLVVVKGQDNPMEARQSLRKINHKRMNLNIAAAAVVAAATSASLFLFSSKQHPQAPTSAAKAVTLQLAKGETVQLGTGMATIPTRYALLNTNAAMLQFTAKPGSYASKENTINVPASQMYSIKLADGTVVHMNAATSLRFPFAFNGRNREVYVDGEAYFSVTADATHPFVVHTKKGDVTVLGTDFNINTYENNFIVSLISGAVVVKPKDGPARQIQPCQAVALDPVSMGTSLGDFKSDQVLGWIHGQYRFLQQPLAEVCKVAERLYGVKFKFDNKQLGKVKYTGIINKKEPVEMFLERLKDNGKVRAWYRDEGEVVHLK